MIKDLAIRVAVTVGIFSMSCDIISGRNKPCDTRAGVETVYLGRWTKDIDYTYSGNTLLSLNADYYEFETINASYTTNLSHTDEGEAYEISVKFDLTKVDKTTSRLINKISDLNVFAILKTYNGQYIYLGLENGLNPKLSETSGGAKNSFNGYSIELSGTQTQIPPLNNIFICTANPCFDYEENGVAYYKLDEDGSTHALDYINNNDGLVNGTGLQGFEGKINKAYKFNNTSQYVELPFRGFPITVLDYGVSFIVKGNPSFGGIITQYQNNGDAGRFGLRFNNDKLSYWKNGSYVYTSEAIIADGNFHICQVTRSAGTVSVYIDGQLDGTFVDATPYQAVDTIIGIFEGSAQALSDTIIDEVYFSDTAFSLLDVLAIYNNGNYTRFETEINAVLEMGQSNIEGRDGDTTNPLYPFTSNNGFYFNGTDKVSINTLRGDAQGGSHANYFAEKYYELTNNKSILLEEARGGAGLTPTSQLNHNWSGTSSLRTNAINKANDYLAYSSFSIKYILWCQGERDAQEMDNNGSYTKAIVKTAMQDVIDWASLNFPNVPFIISETGDLDPATNTQGWQDMRAVQNEIADENENVYIGFSGAKDFPAEGKMSDNVHYDFNGYKEMGEAFAQFINDNL